MSARGETVVTKKVLLAIAIGMGLLGARQVVCRPCSAEAGILVSQVAAADTGR